MYLVKGVFTLFMSLGIGYVLCILAKKQEGILKTLGYTLGTSVIVLSLLLALTESVLVSGGKCRMFSGLKAMKCHAGSNLMKMHHK